MTHTGSRFVRAGSGLLLTGLLLAGATTLNAQAVPATVDDEGVMRWADSGNEVALFGVNYSTPFAHAYRAHGYLGVDRKRAIDADLLHFARLGLDAYRIHVWDREVSDSLGNLLPNDHVDLLDYLMARLANHGIHAILTPIAWWGTGYPERDPETHGLSDGHDKGEMTTLAETRPAQANYLAQFVTHVNPYTGLTYADDPTLLAIEIFNEPSHPGSPQETTAYIDDMVRALRDGGFDKPIFYNISQNYWDGHGHAVCSADIQGVSHQWYPTGLVRNGEIGGNMLPNVNNYPIPYRDFPECRDKARMVYEFDAADVGRSYMYPAMARAFRGAGFQWATQFAYDPLAIAYANTEYQTHFLNLVHTPGKAISFMIAGAAFRQLPRGQSYGDYPANERFGPFRVSYAEDLSEMVADTVFLYSNDTGSEPPSPALLRHVAGVGSSVLVEYDGTGAYFLDRLEEGVWRLEVYPDVAWVVDPFTRPSLSREASRVVWRTRAMRIALPDLGAAFSAEPMDAGNAHRPEVRDGAFDVRPGVYLLAANGTGPGDWSAASPWDGRPLGAFVAPASSEAPTVVLHRPAEELQAGDSYAVDLDVVSAEPVDSVVLMFRHAGAWSRGFRTAMTASGGFGYRAEVPAQQVTAGLGEYTVSVYQGETTATFPGATTGDPLDWDFTGRSTWRMPIVSPGSTVLLFDALRDIDRVLYPHPWEYVRFRTAIAPGSEPGRLALSAVVEDFTPSPHHFALRTFLTEQQRTRLDEATAAAVLTIRARSTTGDGDRMVIGLVERDGTAWGTTIELTESWRDIEVPVESLQLTPMVLLPRPYPHFLPYLMRNEPANETPVLTELDGLQFSVSSRLFPGRPTDEAHGFEIERVTLQPEP